MTDPREARLRRLASSKGYRLAKDRARSWNCDHLGGYMILEDNRLIAGERYELDLDGVETWLNDLPRTRMADR